MVYFPHMKQSLISLSVLVLAGILIFFALQKGGSNGVVCTEDALMCPDGSYVGRTGPSCAFLACPDQTSFEGVLEQTENGFRLIMETPDVTTGATYVMPLELKVSNALADIIGTRVVVFGTFSEGNTLVVDRLEAKEGEAGDATRGVLKMGETKLVNGVKVTFDSIVADSRCPLNAMCVQAGSVTARVTLLSDTDSETVDITAGEKPHGFDAFLVSIENVEPVPTAGVETPDDAYRLHVLVENTTI